MPIGSLKMSILNFKSILFTRWGYKVSAFTQKAARHSENFRYFERFDGYFSNTLKCAKQKLSKIGEKLNNTKDQVLNKIDDGWNAAREELQAEKAFGYLLNESVY